MKRIAAVFLIVSLLLSGCGWMEGSYQSVTPHRQHSDGGETAIESASSYLQLRTALENMVLSGTESSVISVEEIPRDRLEDFLEMAVRYVRDSFPMGAYAVEEIRCEIGTVGGSAALAVEIQYLHDRQEILSVLQVEDMEQARKLIGNALGQYETGLVMLVGDYQFADIHQIVEDFAEENPHIVMEIPETTVQLYPDSGRQRVLELKFIYQSSRDALRTMGDSVQRVFNSAALYVSHDADDSRKLSQLYSFLMERFSEYQLKTSLTPAYSLLNHGVGDSNAFAEVFAEMCQRADVECYVVVGTCRGEPWSWNIVLQDGIYYHVDLLACRQWGGYSPMADAQMGDYVWDYSAYPACPGQPTVYEETQPPVDETPNDEPEQTTGPTEVTQPEESVKK